LTGPSTAIEKGIAMLQRVALPLLLIAVCTACAPARAPEVAAAAPPVPAAAAAPATGPGSGSQVWDVTRITCAQLLNADDDDRAAAMMFYYGYLAATAGIKEIDVGKIDGNIHRVVTECTKAPNYTVPQAFDVAFGRPPRP
jgi:hypothetical protein